MLALIARMKIREGKEADFERVMGHLASQVRSNVPRLTPYFGHREAMRR